MLTCSRDVILEIQMVLAWFRVLGGGRGSMRDRHQWASCNP
jgi:hypothetical protein